MLNIAGAVLGYGDRPVLRIPAFDLPDAGHVLVTGPSGCGKTTLLFALAGLVPAQAGRIAVDGTDLATLDEAARDRFRGRRVGLVFQALRLVRSLSVLDNLLLVADLTGRRRDRAAALAALERLGIADKRDARPETLSQGQAQRAAIARALLHRPALILADEPTSALDDAAAAGAAALLREVAAETGAMLVVATHDARIAPGFERVLRLDAG